MSCPARVGSLAAARRIRFQCSLCHRRHRVRRLKRSLSADRRLPLRCKRVRRHNPAPQAHFHTHRPHRHRRPSKGLHHCKEPDSPCGHTLPERRTRRSCMGYRRCKRPSPYRRTCCLCMRKHLCMHCHRRRPPRSRKTRNHRQRRPRRCRGFRRRMKAHFRFRRHRSRKRPEACMGHRRCTHRLQRCESSPRRPSTRPSCTDFRRRKKGRLARCNFLPSTHHLWCNCWCHHKTMHSVKIHIRDPCHTRHRCMGCRRCMGVM